MKRTTDAMQVLKRVTGIDPNTDAQVQQYRRAMQLGQVAHDARTDAGLTEHQLAGIVGVEPRVILDLEAAEYEGDALSLLDGIAKALNKRVEIRLEPATGDPVAH
ncbi:hypothetical protein Pla175_06710 [Pirellulimonas nuda]|uniref:HTH cro/C1-type domain-containing protein n=1 Tax=Pirellulimonas nuda TaxID=2528009 RepID=A0A518D755_9BACT|nr:helix-turn-helix domain-containing protein [Pirellulimonas nuda]QDU87312.1 hypothetical protein Pla175_06710 [Pirellulimonas nuda]